MASKELEVLDPAATVGKLKKIAAGKKFNRRNFMTALGVTGAASGAALVARRSADPRTVLAAGPSQIDVLNFALNLEFLEATFYSYVTQGTDLPVALTQGSGAITNALAAKLVFTGTYAAQLTDLLNEIYFDELNHVKALLGVLGAAAVLRPALNLAAYGAVSAGNALSLARLFEDVGVTAYSGAASLLSGTYLTYAAQILAVEGFHSGALRLASIQNPGIAGYYPSGTVTNFTGSTTAASKTIAGVYFAATVPVIGADLGGQGSAAGATVTAISGVPLTGGVATVGSAQITGVTSITGIAVGQTVVGSNIPNGTTITVITGTASPYTLTLSSNAVTAVGTAPLSVIAPLSITGTTNKTTTITAVSSVAGLAVGQLITGSGITAGSTIVTVGTTTITISLVTTAAATVTLLVGTGTVTMSANATATLVNSTFFTANPEPNPPIAVTATNYDVQPADPGAALAATGPVPVPTLEYEGFFNTSGSVTSSALAPAGLAFPRTTSQVLSVVYATNGVAVVAGTAKGGFFPNGFNGAITTV